MWPYRGSMPPPRRSSNPQKADAAPVTMGSVVVTANTGQADSVIYFWTILVNAEDASLTLTLTLTLTLNPDLPMLPLEVAVNKALHFVLRHQPTVLGIDFGPDAVLYILWSIVVRVI
uniref:Uncharacterized protein n=1 Tax=uncultured SAR11 cluster alpha proteobacterium H17925_45G17 TaxID=715038 RepID=E7CA49_9PROT|nr:hypothetical protein [uncultured SAR11 cluster alpha proteobacterium H17925_45G17]